MRRVVRAVAELRHICKHAESVRERIRLVRFRRLTRYLGRKVLEQVQPRIEHLDKPSAYVQLDAQTNGTDFDQADEHVEVSVAEECSTSHRPCLRGARRHGGDMPIDHRGRLPLR